MNKQQKLTKMENGQFKIINGTFTPQQAREILITIVNAKINYHVLKGFGNTIRDGVDTSNANNRISELTEIKKLMAEVFEQAEVSGNSLKITGNINIEFVEP